MAVDKLVDSAQLDSDLEDVADAIRAKSGGSSPLAFPSGFISEIASIPSGGGSLPPVISKIDGGSFTLASDTAGDQQSISHSLGVVPKGFVIWTEDEISGTIATRYMANCYVAAANIVDKNLNNYVAVGAASLLYNGTASQLTSNTLLTAASVQSFMDATRIRWYNTMLFYKAGLTYKWLAWA